MDTVQRVILERMRLAGRGEVVTPKDFLDVGTRNAVDQALARLARSGAIQRLGRGLYHYPRVNSRLGIAVAPDIDGIAQAIGRRTGSCMVPSGAVAANHFGLSTQVPAQLVYLSDGRSRRVRVGTIELQIKHLSPKELPSGAPASALVFQALRHIGKGAVDAQVVAKLKQALSPKQKRELAEDGRYTTGWIADAVRQIAGGTSGPAETGHG